MAVLVEVFVLAISIRLQSYAFNVKHNSSRRFNLLQGIWSESHENYENSTSMVYFGVSGFCESKKVEANW